MRPGEGVVAAQPIDVWAPVLTQRMPQRPWLETLLRWTNTMSTTILPTVASTLAAMDEAGGLSILSAWHGPKRS